MKKKTIAILGSTGSIGQSTLEIVRKTKKFNIKLLIANITQSVGVPSTIHS